MAMTVAVDRHHLGRGRNGSNLGLILIERCVATPTKVIGCAKLDEQTVVATNNFPGINRG
jgi:hypothetical protein